MAAQGSGHGAGALISLDGALLLKTERMRGVSVDAAARRARVEAGVLSGELGPAAAEHGLAYLSGAPHRTWEWSAPRSAAGSAG